MDRDQVDGWLAGVDELLAGRRDDESVSEDAMRWSPEAPEVGPVLPAAVWDACVRLSDIQIDPAVTGRIARAFAMSVAEVTRTVHETLRAFGEYVRPTQPEFSVEEQRVIALEARRNRDTGPARPSLGRRIR